MSETVSVLGMPIINIPGAPVVGTTDDVNIPAVNTAAVVTYAARDGFAQCVGGVGWSYNLTPSGTGGTLTVEDSDANTLKKWQITSAGPGFIPFDPPLRSSRSKGITITLSAGGSGVQGMTYTTGRWEESIGHITNFRIT